VHRSDLAFPTNAYVTEHRLTEGRAKMRKFIFAMTTLAVFGFLTSEASAVTVLNTTQADVKKQCEGKTKCSSACGSTMCDYVCDNPKKQCTVAIFLKRPKSGRFPRGASGAAHRNQ
jgi:hypothetical protein